MTKKKDNNTEEHKRENKIPPLGGRVVNVPDYYNGYKGVKAKTPEELNKISGINQFNTKDFRIQKNVKKQVSHDVVYLNGLV